MEIFDNRKADEIKTWNELDQGEVFTDTHETAYPTYYMKVSGMFLTPECYVDLKDGTIYKYMGSGIVPQFRTLNAEVRITD